MKLKTLFSLPYSLLFGYDIFISYTRDGCKDYAGRLYEQLTSLDFSCFIDKKDVAAGRSLNSSLSAALRGSKTLVVIGTATALQRKYVQQEFREFANTGRPIIPINVASSMTAELLTTEPWSILSERDLVWIDETEEAVTSGLPSPEIYKGVQNLFQFTRRNVIRRRWTTVAVVTILGAALIAVWQARNANAQAQIAAEQTAVARTQTQIAEDRRFEVERQTRILREEQIKLAEKNGELEAKKIELETKTQEALANAETARKQEALARTNAETAERRQKSAQSLYLVEQGRREYGTNPMLGLALSLEGLQQVPLEDEATRRAIEGTVRDRIKYGRIARLDQGDFGEPHFLEGTPFFALSRPGKLGELRDTHTGALVQTLTGEVQGATDALYPYFLVHYKDAASELRRRSDAGVVVSGRIKSVGSRFRPGDPYFIVRYQDAPSELRRVDNESVSFRLSDQGSWDEPSLSFVPGAPYFLVTYPKAPAELRRTGTGDIVEKLPLRAISPSLFEITFSHDRSYYAISYYTTSVDRAAELRRTDTNKVVMADRNASTIFFSPISDHLVIGYNDAPGELRRTDSKEIITLSGKVSKAVFNSDDSHFVILYSDVPGEIRSVDSREIIRLSNDIRTVWVDRKGPGFRASYPDDSSVLLHVDGNRLQELPVNTLDPSKARPAYLIAKNPASGAAEIHHATTGEVVLLTGEFAAANSFKYLEKIPYIQIECRMSGPGSFFGCGAFGFIHTLTGKLTSLDSRPSVEDLSPKGTFFVVENGGRSELRRTETAELITSASFRINFSSDDAYVVTNNIDEPDQFVWTNTGKAVELSGNVSNVTFNATSSLLVLEYEGKPTELRRTADGEILRIGKNVSFSADGHYVAITYDDNKSELWVEQDGFHRLADLESGVAGVRFHTSGGRVMVWYEDRHAYLLDLNWLNAIRGMPEKLSDKELIDIACQPFTDSLLNGVDLKRFVQTSPLHICRSEK